MSSLPAQHLQETAAWTQQTFEVSVPVNISFEQLQDLLATRLKQLISKDFGQFIYLLYHIDVSEKKVKAILDDAAADGTDPYRPIAALIIERQLQKIATRASFKKNNLPDDEEKW
ncbi:hypothetical protein [Chitinophaga solisilvae]|uniref:hypothetical protein n=1 Tax=Chitinophaga solisilvae TaxID=1233460 RepID=UPI0013680A4D|nr:hypothetical protein [Chitinophaga solisilvae]